MSKTSITVSRDGLSQGIAAIQQELVRRRVVKSEVLRCTLSTEEMLSRFFASGEAEAILVTVKVLWGKVGISFAAKGAPCSTEDYEEYLTDDDAYNHIVRKLMGRVLGKQVQYKRQCSTNLCTVSGHTSKRRSLVNIFLALLSGIAVGTLLKYLAPEAVTGYLSTQIFAAGSSMFISALKMIVGPLVFFSMASAVADFSDLKALGRIAAKVMLLYLLTSAFAIAVGYGVYQLLPIGDASIAAAVNDGAAATIAKGEGVSVSVLQTIVNIIPSDIVSPFKNGDMLQIIFMGVLAGLGTAAVAGVYPGAKNVIAAINGILSKITAMIIGFLPVAVFCSMAKMVTGMSLRSLARVAAWVPVCYLGDLCMLVIYGLLLLLLARLNPLKFFRGFAPAMLTAYSLSSSNAALPTSMKCCEERLGIDKRIYSFSLPLGATVNMDGSCVTLVVSALFMAKIFGVTVSGSLLTTMFISIMALSIGAPGVPGGALVCLSILLPQLGMPAEGISIVMGIYTLVSMGLVAVNVTGDAVVTTIVAKSEKALDLQRYSRN